MIWILQRYLPYQIILLFIKILGSVRDKILLESEGVRRIRCTYGKCYIGQIKRKVTTRLKEHMTSLRFEQTDTSSIAYTQAYDRF